MDGEDQEQELDDEAQLDDEAPDEMESELIEEQTGWVIYSLGDSLALEEQVEEGLICVGRHLTLLSILFQEVV
jgi:hypothetical protein